MDLIQSEVDWIEDRWSKLFPIRAYTLMVFIPRCLRQLLDLRANGFQYFFETSPQLVKINTEIFLGENSTFFESVFEAL